MLRNPNTCLNLFLKWLCNSELIEAWRNNVKQVSMASFLRDLKNTKRKQITCFCFLQINQQLYYQIRNSVRNILALLHDEANLRNMRYIQHAFIVPLTSLFFSTKRFTEHSLNTNNARSISAVVFDPNACWGSSNVSGFDDASSAMSVLCWSPIVFVKWAPELRRMIAKLYNLESILWCLVFRKPERNNLDAILYWMNDRDASITELPLKWKLVHVKPKQVFTELGVWMEVCDWHR